MIKMKETITDKSACTEGEFINIGFENNFHYDQSVIQTPITYQGKPVGIITDVNSTHVFGILKAELLPEISVDTHKVVSFEIRSQQEKSDVEITCNNIGIKAGSWQCNFCVLKGKCGALKQVKGKDKRNFW